MTTIDYKQLLKDILLENEDTELLVWSQTYPPAFSGKNTSLSYSGGAYVVTVRRPHRAAECLGPYYDLDEAVRSVNIHSGEDK